MRSLTSAGLMLLMTMSLLLTGCTQTRYGNYLADREVDTDHILEAALAQVSELFPPANATLYIEQDMTGDAFGERLVEGLREAGYTIFTRKSHQLKPVDALSFNYRIDQPLEEVSKGVYEPGEMVHVTIFVEKTMLSCGYDLETRQPLTVWTIGEVENG